MVEGTLSTSDSKVQADAEAGVTAAAARGMRDDRERSLRALFYLFFPGGGIGRYTHELLHRLHGSPDLEVELACLPGFHWRAQAQYSVWPGLFDISHATHWKRRSRFLIGQFESPRRMFRRARSANVDIIHLCNINHLTFPLWKRWQRVSGAKIAATVHDVRRGKAILNSRYEHRQLRRFYEQADALFVHSRSQVDDLQSFAHVDPARVHIVPHGPLDCGPPSATGEVLRRQMGWPQNKQIALFFGNIRDEKNLDVLLRALSDFRDTMHLVVAGADVPGHKGHAFYRALAESLGLSETVTFMSGYIPEATVPDLFAACDWSVMPYSRQFTSQSGVLNLTMSCRRPVLATSAPTLAETLEDLQVGVVVEPDSVEALKAGIAILQQQVAAGAPYEFADYLSRFSWTENARRTAAVYRSLVNSSC